MTNRLFGPIVRRLDSFEVDEGPEGVAAQPAVERVLLVLRDDRLDGRQLEHLMSMRFGVLAMQQPRARLALLRDTGNDFVDLFRRHQGTLVPLVPWLSPWLATL